MGLVLSAGGAGQLGMFLSHFMGTLCHLPFLMVWGGSGIGIVVVEYQKGISGGER